MTVGHGGFSLMGAGTGWDSSALWFIGTAIHRHCDGYWTCWPAI